MKISIYDYLSGRCAAVLGVMLAASGAFAPARVVALDLHTERRVAAGEEIRLVRETVGIDPARTAIVVCDMWDRHPCRAAAGRLAEMAPHLNNTLNKARGAGMLVIHSPGGVAEYYTATPQRRAARDARTSVEPPASFKTPLPGSQTDLSFAALPGDPPLPEDFTDGGCECLPACDPAAKPQTRQTAAITIADGDVITDDGAEAWNLIQAHGIKNLIFAGANLNTEMPARPVGFRAAQGADLNLYIMTDMTDVVINSRSTPDLSHFQGADRILAHVTQYVAPGILSSDISGDAPFVSSADDRRHVVFLIHEKEYRTAETLVEFGENELAGKFGWKCTFLIGDRDNELPGVEALADADLLILSVRRQAPTEAQMKLIQRYLRSGGPLVAIRTASHAFAFRKGDAPKGHALWPEFDAEVLGGSYSGHTSGKDAPKTSVRIAPGAPDHPILRGLPAEGMVSGGTLYNVLPLKSDARVLLEGRVGDGDPQPVAWTRDYRGSRIFYTSLGHPDEFRDRWFRRMLVNAAFWAAEAEKPARIRNKFSSAPDSSAGDGGGEGDE